jgi:hypothetical protein
MDGLYDNFTKRGECGVTCDLISASQRLRYAIASLGSTAISFLSIDLFVRHGCHIIEKEFLQNGGNFALVHECAKMSCVYF